MPYSLKLAACGCALSAAFVFAHQPPPQTPPPQAPSPAAVERAARILEEARKAMGGEKLAGIKTLLATGQTKRVRGNNLVPIEFEIALELPDKFVRKDEVPAEESDPTSTGFAGNDLIQFPVPAARGAVPEGRGRGPAPDGAGRATGPEGAGRAAGPEGAGRGPGGPGRAMGPGGPPVTPIVRAKQDFARFALGWFANSLDAFPLTFAYAAQAQAPQGTADVLDVRGAGNFTMRLFIHSETHLPIMVSWQAPPTNVIVTTPGQPPPQTVAPGAVIIPAPAPPAAGATDEDKAKYAKEVAGLRAKAMANPIEYRLYFADYREVDGVKLPFRWRRAIGPDTTEETTFDRYRLNTKIDPRKFTVQK